MQKEAPRIPTDDEIIAGECSTDMLLALTARLDELQQKVESFEAAERWTPVSEIEKSGKIGVPMFGWNPDWVDADFCPYGIRECHLFGDGTEWNSAKWDGYWDVWMADQQPPILCKPQPTPPEVEQ